MLFRNNWYNIVETNFIARETGKVVDFPASVGLSSINKNENVLILLVCFTLI